MLVEAATAISLLLCLVVFVSVNLYNILTLHKRRGHEKVHSEIDRPSGPIVAMAAIGTLVYFVEALIYIGLAFGSLFVPLDSIPFYLQLSATPYVQLLGMALTIIGYSLFIWSVVARGRYATSWGMPEDQKLVTWGPHKFVRHPSYLGYFFMFFGLFFLWLNPFTAIPLLAIPGYVRVASEEEKLLARHFGDEYVEYQKRTGRFMPRLRKHP
jgi:protein-S-isoprenylcysteine O-methyltransferase Ste14